MPGTRFKSKNNLYRILKQNALMLVIVIGLSFFIFDSLYAVIDTHFDIISEEKAYRESVMNRLEMDVQLAVTTVEQMLALTDDQEGALTMVDALDYLSAMELNNDSYYFSADYEGNTLLGPGKGQNVYHIEDKNGLKVVQELIQKAKEGGGFVEYTMPDIDGVAQRPKISYVLPLESYDAYFGAGIEYDVINAVAMKIQRENFKNFAYRLLLFTGLILFIGYGAYRYNKKLYRKIFGHIERLVVFIQKAGRKSIEIPVESFKIDEFKTIAGKMQDLINIRDNQAELLEKQAYYDAVTLLPNRNLFIRTLKECISDLHESNGSFGAVVLIDIDNFKVTNDSFGHKFGDQVLKVIASNLKDHFNDCFVARFGGDEYWLLMCGFDSLEQLDKRLVEIKSFFMNPILVQERSLEFHVSVGVTVFPEYGTEVDDLLRKTDLAMYAAKDEGKNRCVYFDQSLLDGNDTFFYYEQKIRSALLKKEFILHYQPQFFSNSGKIGGFEALIRWMSEDGKIIMPGDFIGVAEKTGLITQITFQVVEMACAFSNKVNSGREQIFPVSINISPQDLVHEEFVEHLVKNINAYNIKPSYIILEITESALLSNFNLVSTVMKKLKTLGFRFALDDFGTGYSSLRYIMELEIDILKIDKSFIDNLVFNVKSRKLVTVVEDIANTLDMVTVAEGVEDESQAQVLREIGIKGLQGYLFSKPLPEDQVIELLNQNE